MGGAGWIEPERGFTSSEILLAAALLGPILVIIFLAVDAMQGAYNRGERIADLQQSARIGMARIVRELRFAGLDPSVVIPSLPIQAPIQIAEGSRVAFISDANGDGSSEKIEYRLDLVTDPPVLRRQQWSTWSGGWSGTNGAQPLAERITMTEFTYFGPGGEIPIGDLPARIGEIRRVRIAITAEAASGHTPAETYRLISEVRIRNAGL